MALLALFANLSSVHLIIRYINRVLYLSIDYCLQLKFALSFYLISTNFCRNGNPSIPKFMHCSKER